MLMIPKNYAHLQKSNSSVWAKLSQEKLFLVRFEIWEILINAFTPNHIYLHPSKLRLPQPPQFQVSEKLKTFSCHFIAFLKYTLTFQNFKNNPASYLKYFWSFWLGETWLFKSIKCPVSEKSSAGNVLRSPKNCSSQQKSNFIWLFQQLWPTWVTKSYFLVKFEIWRRLPNTFNPNREYLRPNSARLGQPLQMQLSKNTKDILMHF